MPNAQPLSEEHRELLATWYPVVVQRCIVKMRDRDRGYEVAQNVIERLLKELVNGKTYVVPYSVVVNNVIHWKVKEYYGDVTYDAEVDETLVDDRADDDVEALEDADYIRWLLADLPDRQREVATLYFVDQLEIEEIADFLKVKRNAVDQALYNAKKKLRVKLDGP